jgi:hypothetical protein
MHWSNNIPVYRAIEFFKGISLQDTLNKVRKTLKSHKLNPDDFDLARITKETHNSKKSITKRILIREW